MKGGKKSKVTTDGGVDAVVPQTPLDPVAEARRINDAMINGEPVAAPEHKGVGKRLIAIFAGIFILSIFSVGLYLIFFKSEPAKPAPAPAAKPTTTSIKIEDDKDYLTLQSQVYGTDYFVSTSGSNYLVNVAKSPKRVIYNGKEVYRGEDISSAILSENGKYWAIQTNRSEMRSKRDENTKIVQDTAVDVATFTINGQKWGERDGARLVGLTDNGAPSFVSRTGKQTPSQYGDALSEEIVYIGEAEKFKTSYGVVGFEMSGDGSNWLATTANPSTKEIYDFFVNNTKKDSLDARILKRISIDSEGNYLLAFCQQGSDVSGIGLIGKDCQISVNGKTRTTISGTVYLAVTLGAKETYAGVDRELKQGFSKNNRSDLILEHRKDLDEDPAASVGVYLNEPGDKYGVTTTRNVGGKIRVNLSINGEAVENTVSSASLFGFGDGDDSATLFIYELPNPGVE